MNRTGLFIALSLALVIGLVGAIYPELDLKLAALFYDTQARTFPRASTAGKSAPSTSNPGTSRETTTTKSSWCSKSSNQLSAGVATCHKMFCLPQRK